VSDYMVIESQDLLDGPSARSTLDLCQNLAKSGNRVEVMLVQNAVLGLRAPDLRTRLTEIADAGVHFIADRVSLQMRGIQESEIPKFVKANDLDTVIVGMASGKKLIWH
jgi:predicted peroxiredoxin